VESVQAEGGINVASEKWLQALARFCREYDILLIIDDGKSAMGEPGYFLVSRKRALCQIWFVFPKL